MNDGVFVRLALAIPTAQVARWKELTVVREERDGDVEVAGAA